MKFEVITIGSATRDVFLNTPEFQDLKNSDMPGGEAICFPLGEKLEIKKIVFTTGGSGTNHAVTFARQGYKTACISIVGQDAIATEIMNELQAEGVSTDMIQKHGDDCTAYSTILVQDGGERTILSYKGEGQHFSAAEISFDGVEADWVLIGSLGGHIELFQKAVDLAVSRNIKIATNPGTKELALGLGTLKPLLEKCAVVSMNREEAAQLLGLTHENEEEIFKGMDEVIGGIFVMTKGHEGVVVSDGTHRYSASVPDSPVVERTGAGDAFVSGFVAEYARSGDIAKSIQLATANSSSVVTQYGSKAGILKKGDQGPWPLVEVLQK
jgi:ribokinase